MLIFSDAFLKNILLIFFFFSFQVVDNVNCVTVRNFKLWRVWQWQVAHQCSAWTPLSLLRRESKTGTWREKKQGRECAGVTANMWRAMLPSALSGIQLGQTHCKNKLVRPQTLHPGTSASSFSFAWITVFLNGARAENLDGLFLKDNKQLCFLHRNSA